MNSYQLLTHTN